MRLGAVEYIEYTEYEIQRAKELLNLKSEVLSKAAQLNIIINLLEAGLLKNPSLFQRVRTWLRGLFLET